MNKNLLQDEDDELLKKQIQGILIDNNYNPQLIFQWCIEIVSYWTLNKGKIKIYKNKNQNNQMWETDIFVNNKKIVNCKSSDKLISMIGACLILENLCQTNIPKEYFEN